MVHFFIVNLCNFLACAVILQVHFLNLLEIVNTLMYMVIYVSTDVKYTRTLATVLILMHATFQEDQAIQFSVMSLKILRKNDG